MSISGLSNSGFNYALFNVGNMASQAKLGALARQTSDSGGLFDSLALQAANLRSEVLGTLLGSGTDSTDSSAGIDALLASLSASVNAAGQGGGANGLSATGRNTALYDPESAYDMMSVINDNDVNYKAQYSELSQMKTYLSELRQHGENLGDINLTTANDSIATRLQAFAGQYNDWVKRFAADMERGGLLTETQAAQVSRYELEQSIENIFNGTRDGLHGLGDLGLTIDPATDLAVVDSAKLESVLASNKQGAVNALQEFSANFARSAELLVSDGNLIPNRLDNLDRVIDYFADNKSSLQAEFGLGDTPKPSGQIARALAAYNRIFGM